MLLLLAVFAIPSQSGPGLGPLVPHPESGRGYRASSGRVTLEQARELARLAGGTLLCLESVEEETWLRATFGNDPTWLGLEHPHEVWASGSTVEYSHWDEGEPNLADREPFAICNWKEDGSWNDVSGKGTSRVIVELEGQAPEVEVVLSQPPAPAGKGALVLCIDGLTQADFEDEVPPNLGRFLAEAARSFTTGCAPSGGSGSGWAMLSWGVGPGKSGFDEGESGGGHYRFDTLQARLEAAWAESTTAWIVDDPDLTRRIAAAEAMDVRLADRREGDSRRAKAIADVLSRPTPALVTIGWHAALAGSGKARQQELAQIDQEIGAVLSLLRGRAAFQQEDWLVVLTSSAPQFEVIQAANARYKRKRPRMQVPSVPLLLCGRDFEPGELNFTSCLTDVVPTVAHHLQMNVPRTWWLDGHPLQEHDAPSFGANLLVNGDAERTFGWSEHYEDWLIPGWRCDGSIEPGVYRAKGLPRTSAGPPRRGRSHFHGSAAADASMEQVVDVRALAEEIDAKEVQARLSGWLGGLLENDHSAALELACLDGAGRVLHEWSTEPVGKSERRRELGAEKGVALPGLLRRELLKKVPAQTRAMRVTLVLRGQAATHQACADDLELVLIRDH